MSRLQRAAIWFDDYWAQLLTVLGSLILALAGIQSSIAQKNWSWILSESYGRLFILGLIFSVVGGLKFASLSPGQKTMESEITKLKQELDSRNKGYLKIVEDELYILSEILEFGYNERISLYKHKSESSAFVMLGRYSANHDYRRRGRAAYPDRQGCAGRALRSGWVFVDDLPDNETEYFQALCTEWDIPLEVCQKLMMRSKTIAACSITNSKRSSTAVIVFECSRQKGFEENRIREVMRSGEKERISLLLEKTADIEPSPEYAEGEGY